MFSLHFFILSTFLLTIQTYSYPSGAPKKICLGPMIPKHHHYTPQPPKTSPITTFNTTWNPDGETISGKNRLSVKQNIFRNFSVAIVSNQPFKGIFVQARKVNGTEPLGTFINIPSQTHLVECSSGDGVTHNSPQKWTNLQLTWKKPTSIKSQETMQFWATVVVDFAHFWVVKSIE